ncbi:MAG: ABC transporter ATP-binding protein [Deinococcales bacterium]
MTLPTAIPTTTALAEAAREPDTSTIPHPETHRVVAELKGVSKRYGEVQALRGVDLQVRSGEVLALLGPNGAGKTTSVGLLLGLLKPTAGEVRLFGGDPDSPDAKVRVGAMLQISGVPATLKVREHLELFSSYYPAPMPIDRTLALAGLAEVAERPYGKLSGGQKQRVHFALALIGNPDLLFLDEPTTGMDVGARRAFWEQVRDFIGSGRTVVLTTHYLEEADALADRIVVVDHGEVIAEGTPAQIKSRTAGRRIHAVTTLGRDEVLGLEGVVSVERNGAALEILARRAEPVVLDLLRRDSALHDLEVGGAGLEDAFLALTKRAQA